MTGSADVPRLPRRRYLDSRSYRYILADESTASDTCGEQAH